MFSFQQFCEHATSSQKYSWFYLQRALYDTLTDEERASVTAVPVAGDETLYRCYYPADKFYTAIMDIDQCALMLQRAIENNNIKVASKLRSRLAELKEKGSK